MAYAKELARRGYDLLLVSNEQERLQQVADELSKAFEVGALPLYMDLARDVYKRQVRSRIRLRHRSMKMLKQSINCCWRIARRSLVYSSLQTSCVVPI